MKKQTKQKVVPGLALTQAFNDLSDYGDEMSLDIRSISNKIDSRQLKSENLDLKKTVKINKEIIASLLSENDDLKQTVKSQHLESLDQKQAIEQLQEEASVLNDKCLILDQIKSFHENNAKEIETQCEERVQEIIEQLDRKEYVMQVKENKWNEIEKIMAIYTKTDYILREQLQQLKYLCDDTSSCRGISSVVKENETLKEQLEAAHSEIDNLMQIIQDLNKSNEEGDLSLDNIIEEMSNASGCTGSDNFQQPSFKVPKLNLNSLSGNKDMTDYKQLYQDQLGVISDLESSNQDLQKRNNKLMAYIKKIKSKNLKYRINAKDSINRMRVVKTKLQEYEGLNRSVFETLNHEEKEAMLIEDKSDKRLSIFSHGSDFGSFIIGGIPNANRLNHPNDASFGKDEEIYATTGSSSQHRRAKSKPFMFKQKSEVKQMELKKLKRELELCDLRRPKLNRFKSVSQGFTQNLQNSLKRSNNAFINLKHQQSDLSDIRFPSERRCESPINVDEIFGD